MRPSTYIKNKIENFFKHKFMKKYESPKMTMVMMNVQKVIASSLYEDDNPLPIIHPDQAVKEFGLEDISSDLFGNESFGGAEEW